MASMTALRDLGRVPYRAAARAQDNAAGSGHLCPSPRARQDLSLGHSARRPQEDRFHWLRGRFSCRSAERAPVRVGEVLACKIDCRLRSHSVTAARTDEILELHPLAGRDHDDTSSRASIASVIIRAAVTTRSAVSAMTLVSPSPLRAT